jgi:hypothetical protein
MAAGASRSAARAVTRQIAVEQLRSVGSVLVPDGRSESQSETTGIDPSSDPQTGMGFEFG